MYYDQSAAKKGEKPTNRQQSRPKIELHVHVKEFTIFRQVVNADKGQWLCTSGL
jgi:hypothetical protein